MSNSQKYEDSILVYRKLIELEPENVHAHFGLAHDLLMTKQYEEGWEEYEWRLCLKIPALEQMLSCIPNVPDWDGSSLEGRRILIYIEQGAGDHIQFLRYLPFVTGGYKIVTCFASMRRLLADVPEIDELVCYEDGVNLPSGLKFDVKASIMSLPYLLGMSDIPPYQLFVNAGPIDTNEFNVGICWAGGGDHKNDFTRSCYLNHFSALAGLGLNLISLQKGNQVRYWQNCGQVDLLDSSDISLASPELNDFYDTAAVIAGLDLVITVDTSVAHLAGTLGCRTWLLLCQQPDWRWGVSGSDTEWYPSMRIFRGSSWSEVFESVRTSLLEIL